MTRERDTAKKIIALLEQGTAGLDPVIAGKLAASRQRAVAAMAEPARVPHAATAYAEMGRFITAHMHGPRAWVPALIALAAALLVFIMWQQNFVREPVEADALLLASDLPPQAYVDKGFDAWLENSSRR